MNLKHKTAARRQRGSAPVEPLTGQYLARLLPQRDKILATIRQMTEFESPSHDKMAVDRLGDWLKNRFAQLGGKVQVHAQRSVGNHLQVEFASGHRKEKPVLLLGHFDTVYDLGTLAHMPCRVQNGRLHGPGVFDMKSGIAFMLHAIETLQVIHRGLPRPVSVLLVSDEEVGSGSSCAITEKVAKRSAAVLVLEPSAGLKGALKTSRKGVGDYTIEVHGEAAHAGLDPGKGHSAINELAQQITRIASFNEPERGLTVNVGTIQGGTRTNVIAAHALAAVDIRLARLADAARIDRKFRALRPVNRSCKLEISGGVNRPPMERNAGTLHLFALAKAIAHDLGWALEEASVGGGSDGNFTAALGIPTLDGLGGVGDGAHASHEHVLIDELPRRTALLAALLATIE
jgi:glutamate carboxypeptidase